MSCKFFSSKNSRGVIPKYFALTCCFFLFVFFPPFIRTVVASEVLKAKCPGEKVAEMPQLYKAISKGDLGQVKRLINNGADIHSFQWKKCYPYREFTPLAWAAKTSKRVDDSYHAEMVKVLLDAGADPNHGVPLYDAEDISVTRILLERGAETERKCLKCEDKIYPILVRAYSKNIQALKLYTENGAALNVKDHKKRTILHRLFWVNIRHWPNSSNLIEMMEYLVERGVGVDDRDSSGHTPAFYLLGLAHSGNLYSAVVSNLLELGADPCAKNLASQTLVMKAVKRDIFRAPPFSMIGTILARGGDLCVSDFDQTGENALFIMVERHILISEEDVDLARLLIRRGADVEHTRNDGATVLVKIASFFCRRSGPSPWPRPLPGRPSWGPFVNMIDLLIVNGVDKAATDSRGKTAYNYAAASGNCTSLKSKLRPES